MGKRTMYCRKSPSYGSGHYSKPTSPSAKVGYQEPREDVARPFKAREYNSGGYYSIYKGVTPAVAGSASSPLKSFEQKEFERSEDPTYAARAALHSRDARLNGHRTPYGHGAWKGDSYIAAGGGTAVPQKPMPRTHPKQVGSDGSLVHTSYGEGEYVRRDHTEHPDSAGFSKLAKRGIGSPSKLTSRPGVSRGDVGKPAKSMYGGTEFARPVTHDYAGIAGIHYSTRKGGVSEAKYLPTHDEAVMGQNRQVSAYGQGEYASPVKPMVAGRYGQGHPWEQRRDLAGYGAFVSPRSGIY